MTQTHPENPYTIPENNPEEGEETTLADQVEAWLDPRSEAYQVRVMGCDLAITDTDFGTVSHRNAERAGMRLAYMEMTFEGVA